MTTNRPMRRAMGTLVLAVGMLAYSAAGAGAVGVRPALLGVADSHAIKIKLTLPSPDQLRATLEALGVPKGAIPKLPADCKTPVGDLPTDGCTIEQVISLNQSSVGPGRATGTASLLAGLLQQSVSTTCTTSGCNESQSMGQKIEKILDPIIKGGIGTVKVAGADSMAKGLRTSVNSTGLVHVDLSLANLIGPGGLLAVVGENLNTLTSTVNDLLDSNINPALEQLFKLAPILKDTLKDFGEVGPIKHIPTLTNTSLLNLDVLTGNASVQPGANRFVAQSESRVSDIHILGTWLTIDSIVAKAQAFVDLNSNQKLAAVDPESPAFGKDAQKVFSSLPVDATRSLGLTAIDLAGLLKIGGGTRASIEEKLMNNAGVLLVEQTLREHEKDLPGTEKSIEDLIAAIDILTNTAGITVDRIKGFRDVPKSFHAGSITSHPDARTTETDSDANLNLKAESLSDMIRILVAPKIPLVQNGFTPAGSLVPRLGPEDYVPTGLKLEIDLPRAHAMVAQGAAVLGFHIARTGVPGVRWLAVIMLVGAAVMIRKFALSK